jgi:hypothetical protein
MSLEIVNPATADAAKTIVVFGLGRGGTSAIAGILRILGMAVLEATHPLKHESSPIVYEGDVVDRDKTRLRIAEMNDRHSVWGWKSPRDIFQITKFNSLLRNPHYIVILRNVFDVCASTKRYEGLPFEATMPDVAAAFSEIAHFVKNSTEPLALMSFGELTSNPAETIKAVATWLGFSPSRETFEFAVQFVSKGDYRAIDGKRRIDWDIAVDAEQAQRRIYAARIRELGEMIAAVESDSISAQQILNANVSDADVTADKLESKYQYLRQKFKVITKQRASLQHELDALSAKLSQGVSK